VCLPASGISQPPLEKKGHLPPPASFLLLNLQIGGEFPHALANHPVPTEFKKGNGVCEYVNLSCNTVKYHFILIEPLPCNLFKPIRGLFKEGCDTAHTTYFTAKGHGDWLCMKASEHLVKNEIPWFIWAQGHSDIEHSVRRGLTTMIYKIF
jgi:hypothetical protein